MQIKYENILNTKSEKFTLIFENGLELSTVVSGRVKDTTKQDYKIIVEYLAAKEKEIQIVEIMPKDKLLVLPASFYWNIYKKLPNGKQFVLNQSFIDQNNESYRLPAPQMYFNGVISNLNGGRGIYGIYCNDILIYIGYTYNSFNERYDQHREYFSKKAGPLPMYSKYDLNKIEFRELVTEEDIQKLFETDCAIDREILQIIEYSLIKVLNPIENAQGRIRPYQLNTQSLRLAKREISTAQLVKDWLLGDIYASEEEVNEVFEEG